MSPFAIVLLYKKETAKYILTYVLAPNSTRQNIIGEKKQFLRFFTYSFAKAHGSPPRTRGILEVIKGMFVILKKASKIGTKGVQGGRGHLQDNSRGRVSGVREKIATRQTGEETNARGIREKGAGNDGIVLSDKEREGLASLGIDESRVIPEYTQEMEMGVAEAKEVAPEASVIFVDGSIIDSAGTLLEAVYSPRNDVIIVSNAERLIGALRHDKVHAIKKYRPDVIQKCKAAIFSSGFPETELLDIVSTYEKVYPNLAPENIPDEIIGDALAGRDDYCQRVGT